MIITIVPPKVTPEIEKLHREHRIRSDGFFLFEGTRVPITVYDGLEGQLVAVNHPIKPELREKFSREIKGHKAYKDPHVIYSTLEIFE